MFELLNNILKLTRMKGGLKRLPEQIGSHACKMRESQCVYECETLQRVICLKCIRDGFTTAVFMIVQELAKTLE